jgi:hypothetical protein
LTAICADTPASSEKDEKQEAKMRFFPDFIESWHVNDAPAVTPAIAPHYLRAI